MLIVPDVHGRDFWKIPVQKTLDETDEKIIFLGDYLDPYPEEWIDPNDPWRFICNYKQKALDEFRTIIDLKMKYPERIILLIGNHCLHYVNGSTDGCRYDRVRAKEIEQLYKDHWDLFDLAYETIIDNKHYIFSHAGITKAYAETCYGKEATEDTVVKLFNEDFHKQTYGIMDSLDIYDKYRGWNGRDYASLLWTDVHEWTEDKQEGYGYQIFGHTWNPNGIITDTFACLDCEKTFVLNKEGIKEIKA